MRGVTRGVLGELTKCALEVAELSGGGVSVVVAAPCLELSLRAPSLGVGALLGRERDALSAR